MASKGKPVSTLRAGRYKFALSNRDPKTSFKLLGPTSKAPQSLTRSATIRLTRGRWTYYTTVRTVRYFRVS